LGAVAALAVASVSAALLFAGLGPASTLFPVIQPSPGHTTSARVRVTIEPRAKLSSVPNSFLGVSTEYGALQLFERHGVLLDRVLSLLRVRGGGPLILRVGGTSADRVLWDPSAQRLPRWAIAVTPAWFAQTGELVRRAGLRLIVDLNLATATPPVAAQVAGAAERLLPRGSIAGFEVGNEPDVYDRAPWLATIAHAGLRAAVPASEITPIAYARDFGAYARVLARIAPRVALVGPALAYPRIDAAWLSTLLAGPHPRLGIVSVHLYPYTRCASPDSPQYPTIARLLSENATAGLAGLVRTAVRLAHNAGLPLRMTELNSISCGGLPGVSNSFATALWAPDALFELLQAGVDGVNVHIRADAINGAFALTGHGLIARPLLYGLILFARTLGPDAQLVHAQMRAPRSLHLKVWAVRVAGDMLHVLLLDKGKRSVNVDLQLPATGSATVQRLRAPSARARSGVTLDGQGLGRDGRWQGKPTGESISPGPHGYELTVPRLSGALVIVRLVSDRSLPAT
jgi:hypothetical protein